MSRTIVRPLFAAGAFIATVLLATTANAAVPAAPQKSIATLTVVYELKGAGKDIPASHEHHYEWTVNDRFEVTAKLPAQAASPVPSLFDKPEGAPSPEVMSGDPAAAMKLLSAARAKCGDDSACLQRELTKAATGSDRSFQAYFPGTQQGTYTIDETAHYADFDAACSLKNEAPCAYDKIVKGSGALSINDGKQTAPSDAVVELDLDNGGMMLTLPSPGLAKTTQTVTTQSKEIKAGTSDVVRAALHDKKAYQKKIAVACGACMSASGSETFTIADDLLGKPATLTVNWTLKR